MRMLAIDCATEACSVALFDSENLVAREHEVLGRGHAEYLIPMIERLPGRGKAARIAVSLGPGSFTGVRIGLAAARSLGIAWDAQVVGYPTLALIAAMAREENSSPVTVCMTGGHGEWFIQDYDAQGMPEWPLVSIPVGEAGKVGAHALVAGSQAKAKCELGVAGKTARELLPDAAKVPLVPETLFTATLQPLYGRAPDARAAG